MEIVINSCYGGFGLSHEAILKYAEKKGMTLYWFEQYHMKHYCTVSVKSAEDWEALPNKNDAYFSDRDIDRTDKDLVSVIREMKSSANGDHAELEIIEIPDDVEYVIDEYDGIESIHEEHRVWP